MNVIRISRMSDKPAPSLLFIIYNNISLYLNLEFEYAFYKITTISAFINNKILIPSFVVFAQKKYPLLSMLDDTLIWNVASWCKV